MTMAHHRIIVGLAFLILINAKIVPTDTEAKNVEQDSVNDIEDVFNGVYTECFARFSFSCVQRKTLMYLKQLDSMSEISLVGDYVKFVKLNTSKVEERSNANESLDENSEELTKLIDKAIDRFFDNHIVKFSALGRDISMPSNVEEFVGRKKRKGGGGGGEMMMSGHGGGHGFGSKKMMMMAMVCMKMKMMMMLPAMMGMMGMMSFKGMMFSMMSFMLAKMMLLMKLLEKKGAGGGGIGGSGGDGGWAAAGGGGGAWMPAGGQDFGGGGGYDANGQWQSRSILENHEEIIENKPIYSYVAPVVTYNNPNTLFKTTAKKDKIINVNKNATIKSRKKRSIIDALQNSYMYWMNRLLGVNNNRRTSNYPKYKIVNGIKYVFYPYRQQRFKTPKEIQSNKIKNANEEPVIITAEDFNKGEIMEGGVESRMNRKSMMEMKDAVNETLDDNPWK